MTKRAEAKYKIDRRMGENIWGRPRSPFNKREYGPGSTASAARARPPTSAPSSRPSRSSRAITATFPSVNSTNIMSRRSACGAISSAHLIGLLERRLDAVVYRAKFVPTVFAARQFVNHGHIKVNGRRVNISSYQVKVGDLIEIKEASKQLALVMEAAALAERDVPDYLEVDHGKGTAKLTRVPGATEVPYPTHMEPNLVIEFYSR